MKLKSFFIQGFIVIAAVVFVCRPVTAGVTGKIAGLVSDAQNEQGLPGVNISVEGKIIGASTFTDGYYVILQVPPGTYTLRFSMIGYHDMLVENVKVSADHTTQINAELQEDLIEIDEAIVVIANRPVIQKDVTSSTQFVGAEEMLQLPVIDAKEALMLQTGVFFNPIPLGGGFQNSAGRGEARYSVRGGSQDEVKWYMDGVRTSSGVAGKADWGGSFTNVNLNAIEEAQVITGGFNAEYGEAQSGIVNTVIKEGDDKWVTSVDYMYSPPGQRHFGNYLYDQSTQKEFLDNTLEDGTLDTSWWTPYRQRQVYDYRKFADHQLSLTLGGKLFKLGSNPLYFFLAGLYKDQAYTLPHPRNSRTEQNILLNISHRPSDNMKLKINGMYNHDAHSTLQEIGEFTNQAKYYRGWGSLLDTYTYLSSLLWSHTISPTLFYELKLSHFLVDFNEKPSKYTMLGQSDTQTIWGFHRYEGLIDEPYDKYAPILKNHNQSGDISLTGNLNWQFDRANLLKSGIELRYNTAANLGNWRYPTYSDDPELWSNRGLQETYHPIQFAAYLQDKMEFESMILNVGVRYDYLNPNYDWFDNEGYYNLAIDPEFNPALDPDGDQVDSLGRVKYSYDNVLAKPRSPAKSYHLISPRFGVSFPVTENSLLHFNYGHFYQMPPFDQMFSMSYFRPFHIVDKIAEEREAAAEEGREPNHIASPDGDPERVVSLTIEPLKPQKTVQFEVGLKYNFEDFAVVDITAYYKDVTNQTEENAGLFDRMVRDVSGSSYSSYFPGDYGDSRGFEISLRTLFSRWVTLDVNYSFSKSLQGRASPGIAFLQQDGSVTFTWDEDVDKRVAIEKSYSRPHIVRANLFFVFPDDFTGSFADFLLNDLTASFLYRYVSGQSFTYLAPDDPPDTYDNYRYPAYQKADFKIEKMVELISDHQVSFYLRITNLFNEKNLRSMGEYFGASDDYANNVYGEYVNDGKIRKTDFLGYDISWQTYHEPRRFYFGLKYFFN